MKNEYLQLVRAALWGKEPVVWPEEMTEDLLRLNAQQGTGPLVYPLVLNQESLSSYARTQMKSVCMRTMQQHVQLQYTLQTVWQALEKAGIRAVLMKGASLAALYPDPHQRAWGDIDLFVGKEQYHPACAVMRDTFPNALKFDEELDHYKHYNIIADGISIETHRVTVGFHFQICLSLCSNRGCLYPAAPKRLYGLLGAGGVPTVDLVGRDIDAHFGHSVHGHTVDAQFGRNTGEVKAADCRHVDFKPGRLAGSNTGFVCADQGFPSGLERGSQVRGEAKRTTGVLQAGDIPLPHGIGQIGHLQSGGFRVEVGRFLDVGNRRIGCRGAGPSSRFDAVFEGHTRCTQFKSHCFSFLTGCPSIILDTFDM